MAPSDTFVPPPPEAVGRMLEQLLGRRVTTKDGRLLVPGPNARTYVGIYRSDQGTLAAAVVMDLPLAANAAAALVMVPVGMVSDSVRSGQLSPSLLDNLREVMNVCTRFFNLPGKPHLKLQEIMPCPPALPADVAALVARPNTGLHIEMAITGYGGGKISLVA